MRICLCFSHWCQFVHSQMRNNCKYKCIQITMQISQHFHLSSIEFGYCLFSMCNFSLQFSLELYTFNWCMLQFDGIIIYLITQMISVVLVVAAADAIFHSSGCNWWWQRRWFPCRKRFSKKHDEINSNDWQNEQYFQAQL